MSKGLFVNSSPHIKTEDNIAWTMLYVVFALLPSLVMSIIYFGFRALFITLLSVVSCAFFEFAYRKLMKKSFTLNDFSSVVTGMLLAFCLPPTAPYWLVLVGSFFAIVIVKELFGGLGQNFLNPALVSRAFLFSFPVIMTTWVSPFKKIGLFIVDKADAVSSATPLAVLASKNGNLPEQSIYQMLVGERGGSLGEVCSVFLILGGLYLLYQRVITWHIPVSFIGTVAILTFIFHFEYDPVTFMLYHILGGGLLLGAIFMATDYTTSPLTNRGKLIYGLLCGVLTVAFRFFGSFPEGVCYAILIMNTAVWLIDKNTKKRRFGTGGGALNV